MTQTLNPLVPHSELPQDALTPRHTSTGSLKILIRDLTLPFLIGILPEEQGRRQAVRINVQVTLPDPGPGAKITLSDTLSYAEIVEGIRRISEEGHIDLVETLADRIVALCLAHPRAFAARVRVEKTEILPETAGVGVELERWR